MGEIVYSAVPLQNRKIGGFADRLKGIFFTYSLANILGWRFRIYWPEYYEQMRLNLKDESRLIIERGALPDGAVLDLIDWPSRGKHNVVHALIDSRFKESTFIINANILSFDMLSLKKEDVMRGLGMESWKESILFKNTFDALFHSSPALKNNDFHDEFFDFKRKQKFLIGVQLRFGGWENWDDPLFLHPRAIQYTPHAIEQVKRALNISKIGVYFSTDNGKAKAHARSFLGDRYSYFSFDKDPEHFERSKDINDEDFDFINAEHYCLSKCNFLITGFGQFGVTAAYRGGVPYADFNALVTLPRSLDFLLQLAKFRQRVRIQLTRWPRKVRKRVA